MRDLIPLDPPDTWSLRVSAVRGLAEELLADPAGISAASWRRLLEILAVVDAGDIVARVVPAPGTGELRYRFEAPPDLEG